MTTTASLSQSQASQASKDSQTTNSSNFNLNKLFTTTATLTLILAIILAFFNPLKSTISKTLSSATPSSIRAMSTSATSTLKVTKRPWNARGHADHGWLYTYHTFSFASYYNQRYESYGPLRVINEDRVERGTGFGKHAHAEFLIWSYVVSGELEHEDSMGNKETLTRGEVQFTSAGTGIRHSEYNRNKQQDVHFLQIWAKPHTRGLKPSYKTRRWSDEEKTDKLVRIMEAVERHDGGEEETSAIPLHAELSMDASILSPGKKVVHELVKEGARKVYVHVVMRGRTQPKEGGAKVKVGDVVLGEGDGAFVDGASGPGKLEVESVGDVPAEFLLFDMGPEDA
jgi:quercetin 2,3-dioxygenase